MAWEKWLSAIDGSQLIVVQTNASEAFLRFYERRFGEWSERRHLRAVGVCGRGGVTADKREGDGCTPCGLFAIGEAFYIGRKPFTQLATFAVTRDTYWIDDPASPLYNRRICATQRPTAHAEHMIEYAEYVCGMVIEHNPCCLPHAGSAVFLHATVPSTVYTAGCIATDVRTVRRYLRRLNAACHPYILIQ